MDTSSDNDSGMTTESESPKGQTDRENMVNDDYLKLYSSGERGRGGARSSSGENPSLYRCALCLRVFASLTDIMHPLDHKCMNFRFSMSTVTITNTVEGRQVCLMQPEQHTEPPPMNEEVRLHPHSAQIAESQASFTAPPATPSIPSSLPVEGPREGPPLLEIIPTGPGSDFNGLSSVAATVSSTSRPPPATAALLELIPTRPTFNRAPPLAGPAVPSPSTSQRADEHSLKDHVESYNDADAS